MGRGSLLAAVALVGALAAPASAAAQRVLYVGDSLGVGTTPGVARELGPAASVRGDSRIGRPSPEGLEVLRRMVSPSDEIVVFDLGTNDDPARPQVLAGDLAAARKATGDRCMVVATLNRPPLNGVPVDGLNQAVLAFASQEPNVELVDWNAIVASEPRLLGPDRVHPTPAGYGVRAQLFAEAITSCGGDDALAEPDSLVTPKPAKKRKPKARPKVPGIEASGISFSEPLRFSGLTAQLRLPNTKPPYPAVAMPGGTQVAAEFLAEHGIATLTYRDRGRSGDTRAAVALLDRRDDVRPGGVGVWAVGQAAGVAAAVDGTRAIVAIAPSPLAEAVVRDWRIRRELDAGAPAVTKWLRMTGEDEDAVAVWAQVDAPVLAIWGTRDTRIPIRASAEALRRALASGPNRDRTFRWFAGGHAPFGAPGMLEEAARWLGLRLGAEKAQSVVKTPLPPANGGPAPIANAKASALLSEPVQIAWLAIPMLLLTAGIAQAAIARRRAASAAAPIAVEAEPAAPQPAPIALLAIAEAVATASLVAIAIGIMLALHSDGRDIAAVAGTPWPFALAGVLAIAAAGFAVVLLRRRAFLPAAAIAAWAALALYWLL